MTIHLRHDLPDGAYVADYTVDSADGHIVSGGVVFLVGVASPGRIGVLARHSSTAADDLGKFGQFLTYLGVLAAVGLAFFSAFAAADRRERRRLGRLAAGAAVVGVLGMAVTIDAQASLATGGHLALASFDALRSAASGGLGWQCAVQLVCLVGCLASFRAPLRTTAQVLALYSTIGAAGAFVLFGHARAGSPTWATVPADVVHVMCAAVWLGGLIGLVVVLRSRTSAARRTGEIATAASADPAPMSPAGGAGLARESTATVAVLDPPATRTDTGSRADAGSGRGANRGSILESTVTTVRRVSTMAAVSVIALMIAGTVLGITLVGSVSALFETTYGQLLLAKLAVFGLLLVMAAYNRWFLLPWLAPAGEGAAGHADRLHSGWRVLMRTARVEVLGVVTVLAITAMLANTTPPSATAAVPVPVPYAKSAAFAGGHLRLRISPNQALVNDVRIDITDAEGRPVDHAKSVSAFFTLPSKNVGPLASDLKRVGVGQYALLDTPLPPIVGQWQITVQIRVDDFNEVDLNFTDDVR